MNLAQRAVKESTTSCERAVWKVVAHTNDETGELDGIVAGTDKFLAATQGNDTLAALHGMGGKVEDVPMGSVTTASTDGD